MKKEMLYKRLAWIWPIISPYEDYIDETKTFINLIEEYAKIPIKTLLHLGCGGGHHDYTFHKHFKVTGVDKSKQMLDLARKLNPTIEYLKSDMRNIKLEHKFDCIVGLDGLNYLTTKRDLKRIITKAYKYLNDGGVFFMLVEVTKEKFVQNKSNYSVHNKDNIEITYFENYYDKDTKDTEYEIIYNYLIRKNKKLSVYTEKHVCGIFKLDTWIKLLNKIGFTVNVREFVSDDTGDTYPILVCVK